MQTIACTPLHCQSPPTAATMKRCKRPTLLGFLTLLILGLCTNLVESSPSSGRSTSNTTTRIQQCREGCLEKFTIKESQCQKRPECSTCWDECAKPPPPKINKSIRETWTLRTVSMLQQDSLVLVDVAWTPLNTPNQCLVTWEVSGGGLMGNLLTESFNVQLSLWPDTKYRVQVTCKNKLTGGMSRSLPLTIDTSEAVITQDHGQQQLQKQLLTTLLPWKNQQKSQQSYLPNSIQNSIPTSSSAAASAHGGAGVDGIVGVPFDDGSAESMNQHTNSIFNWQEHTKNSDISKIEPISKPDLNILKIAALSDLQKPLVFGVIAGSLLLVVILFLYVCMLRTQRVPSDKTALIDEDSGSVIVSMPRTLPSSASASASSLSWAPAPRTQSRIGESCKNAAICSRNALKV